MYQDIPNPDKPMWDGPFKGGVTQSILSTFLQCPFKFYLQYICGLRDPKPPEDNLVFGSIGHVGLEYLILTKDVDTACQEMRYYKDIEYPEEPERYYWACCHFMKLYDTSLLPENCDPEIEIDTQYYYDIDKSVRARGKKDIDAPGFIGDHKFKGYLEPLNTKLELKHDLQMNFYSACSDYANNWIYDLFRIPDPEKWGFPAQRAGESQEEWMYRVFYTHRDPKNLFPISDYKQFWIYQIPYTREKELIGKYNRRTIIPLIKRLVNYWEYVTQPGFDPNDDKWYNEIFYTRPCRFFDPSTTDKFKGNYYEILTEQYDYYELKPIEQFYSELSEPQKCIH